MFLRKILILITLLQFSVTGFSQEEKKRFNFKSSSMVSSYVLLGTGALILGVGGSELESIDGYLRIMSATAGPATIASGLLVGVIDIVSQLMQMKKDNPLAYNEFLNGYEDLLVDSEVVALDSSFGFQSKCSKDLMNGLKHTESVTDKNYEQSLAKVVVEIDSLAIKAIQTEMSQRDIDSKLSVISQGVMNLQHARNLVALKMSSLI